MAQTKEELLKYFASLDVARLQKLQNYSKLLIIPEEDLLSNATMSQMVQKAHSLADSLFPEWTDRSESDFGEFLVELFAIFSEKDFWYLNAFANESILRKMRSYSNAFSKASSMGYQAITCKSASASFNVQFVAGPAATYHRGDLLVSVGDRKFTNWDEFSLPVNAASTTKQITLHEGTLYAEDFMFSGYSVLVRKENIDINSISVVIDNITYTRVNNFGFSSPESTHYLVIPEEDGSVGIFFGDGTYGIKPPIGKAIHVEYRKSSGADGNLSVQTASVLDSLASRSATSVTMLTASTGGTDADTFAAIREKAPTYFATKRAVINEEIAEKTLNNFPFVHKSKVKVMGRQVSYMVIPTSGNAELNSSELSTLNTEFAPYVMGGYEANHANNQYVNLLTALGATKFIVDAIVAPGYDMASIRSGILQVVSDVTNPLVRAEYGVGITKSGLDILIRSSVAGVQNCTFKKLSGSTESIIPEVVLGELEIFSTIDTSKVEVRLNVV